MSNQPNGPVPAIRGNRTGSRGGRTYAALQNVWDRMSAEQYLDAMKFADEAASAYMLNPASVRSYLYALVAEGKVSRGELDQDGQHGTFTSTVVRRGNQFEVTKTRAFYRIVEAA